MPFPLAHPAAVLPLRRYCTKHLSFAALVTASIVPDVAYFADDYSKFSNAMVVLFGASADELPFVDSRWEWSDFSHSIIGSLVFCLPIGLLIQSIFYPLRGALVSTLPNPHRSALLPLCSVPRKSIWVIGRSLLIGIWIHLFWDLFTHENARAVRTWEFVHHLLGLSPATQSAIKRAVWIVSSVGGVAALIIIYLCFLNSSRVPLRFFSLQDTSRFLLWLGVLMIPALITWPIISASGYTEPSADYLYIFHAFAELYLVVLSCCVLLLSISSKIKHLRAN